MRTPTTSPEEPIRWRAPHDIARGIVAVAPENVSFMDLKGGEEAAPPSLRRRKRRPVQRALERHWNQRRGPVCRAAAEIRPVPTRLPQARFKAVGTSHGRRLLTSRQGVIDKDLAAGRLGIG